MPVDERLTALDATFLELEEADSGAHMHIGGVMLFEPRADGRAPSVEEVCAHLERRMEHLPRYGKRLSSPTTGGLSWPAWEEDERFDLAGHVRRAALPAPGTHQDLIDWAGEYFSERLDRSRPLWELVVVEGLEGGGWALVSKTHHAMVDGVGAVDVGGVILDTEPGSGNGSGIPFRPRQLPPPALPVGASPLSSVASSAWGLAQLPLRAGRAGASLVGSGIDVALHPSKAVDGLKRSEAMVDLLLRDELVAAPKTSLNVRTGGRRRLAVTGVSLGDAKAIGKALGGTVNDVVLAATAGGLRDLLLSRGEEPPPTGLRAMVPVNLRTAGEHLALGNKITTLFVHLPVAEPDPMRRFGLQVAEAESLKAGHQGVGSRTLIDFTTHAPPVIHSFLARSMYATRLFNLTVTNVPGAADDALRARVAADRDLAAGAAGGGSRRRPGGDQLRRRRLLLRQRRPRRHPGPRGAHRRHRALLRGASPGRRGGGPRRLMRPDLPLGRPGALRPRRTHQEVHLSHRTGWLRAAVLGANDGIVSTASLVLGVAASGSSGTAILTAGIAGLAAGALSMAAGEYVSVSSQRDSERADLRLERRELAANPDAELRELQSIYQQRGVPPELALEVARALTERDALEAHARDELGLTRERAAQPLQAAWASALSFAAGAIIPVLAVGIAPADVRIWICVAVTLAALAILGYTGARLGGGSRGAATGRVVVWGAIAMAVTSGIGALVGAAV